MTILQDTWIDDGNNRIVENPPDTTTDLIKEWFASDAWDQIGDRIFIEPYQKKSLGLFSYDLHVGKQIKSLRYRDKPIHDFQDNKPFVLEPGDTAIVLTKEFIGLPKTVTAYVEPRFCYVREGLFQSMVKIDPTWYGHLGIAVVNLSARKITFNIGDPFATLVFYKMEGPCSESLNQRGRRLAGQPGQPTSARGRTSLGAFLEPAAISSEYEMNELERVSCCPDTLRECAVRFGPPFNLLMKLPQYTSGIIVPGLRQDVLLAAEERLNRIFPELIRVVLMILAFLGVIGTGIGLALRLGATEPLTPEVIKAYAYPLAIISSSVFLAVAAWTVSWIIRRSHTQKP